MTPSLKVAFGNRLSTGDRPLIYQCLEFVRLYCGIDYTEIQPKPIHARVGFPATFGLVDLTSVSTPFWALRRTADMFRAIGRPREADALEHVLYLCFEDRELGGLDLDPAEPLSEKDRETLSLLIDAWLQASTHTVDAMSNTFTGMFQDIPRRPMTLSEKIFTHHMLPGKASTGVKPGDVIRVSVDWILASEASWAGMLKTIEAVGATQIWRNDRFWLAGDHIVDPRNKHLPKVKALIEKSEKAQRDYKLTEYQGQNYTILHTEFVRERAQSGMLVLGSDSHTCSSGAVGCLGIGLGAADVAMSLLTGISWFKVPESIRINMVGEPGFGIGGKDIILYILGKLKRNTVAADRIVEFGGPGTRYLSVDDRFAICNMCTEFGAITGLFVPDGVVLQYIYQRKLKLHKTKSLFVRPDDNAVYAETYEIDLGNIQPYVALYPSPDNVVPVTDCPPMTFDGVFIGACTTTEEDLILGALVLQTGLARNMPQKRGKRHVVFGSLPITKRLRQLGIVDIYKEAGFETSAPGCSFCVGMGADQAVAGETWLSSQNRNFKNRMGKGSFANLSSAAVVAASSFTMSLTDPAPFLQQIDKSLYQMVTRKTLRERVSGELVLYTEPQIPAYSMPGQTKTKSPERSDTPTRDWIISSRIQNLGDFIDTDALAPAEFFIDCKTDEELGQHCLEHTHPGFREAVRSGRQVIVAGQGFGCGSSREEAPRALMGIGVQCVIAKSFAFIYGRNQPTLGLLGITMTDPSFHEAATNGADIKIDVHQRQISIGNQKWTFELDDFEIKMLLNRGLAEAYKRFGKGVFDNLCDREEAKSIDMVSEPIHRSLEW